MKELRSTVDIIVQTKNLLTDTVYICGKHIRGHAFLRLDKEGRKYNDR